MELLLWIPAAAGLLAVLKRVLGAGFRVLGRGVERFMAREVAEVRARRGDLTGMTDARAQRRVAVQAQLGAVAYLGFWVVVAFLPLLTPWPLGLYAAYSVLWLVPRIGARGG